jgi:hypothetical protein
MSTPRRGRSDKKYIVSRPTREKPSVQSWLAWSRQDSSEKCYIPSDCYSRYHQISLAKEDKEKTAFITPFGAFCYTSMPFGLKNAGATYQRAIQTCLAVHWGKRVEAYVNDVVIKTENSENFIEDLHLVFNSLRRYRWKLNPEKCVFGVPAGKLLGFIVSHRGIEANPEKIKAIMRMEAPRSQKKVQRLTGCMAALSRFISRLGEKGLPFYKVLKKVDKFQWTSEAQEALDALKKFLTTPLLELALRCKLIQRGSVATQTGFLHEMTIALLI